MNIYQQCRRCKLGSIIYHYNRLVCHLCSRQPDITYRKAVRADGRYKDVLLPGDDGYEAYADEPAPMLPRNANLNRKGSYSDDAVRAMRASDMSNKELAAIYGGTANMIAKLRRGQTYSWVDPGVNIIAKNEHRKLYDDEVRKIRQSKKPGSELARQYGISPSAVTGIRQRKLYASVADA